MNSVLCVKTRENFQWLNLEGKGSGWSVGSKKSPETRMAAPKACLRALSFPEGKQSVLPRDTFSRKRYTKSCALRPPDILPVCLHAQPFPSATVAYFPTIEIQFFAVLVLCRWLQTKINPANVTEVKLVNGVLPADTDFHPGSWRLTAQESKCNRRRCLAPWIHSVSPDVESHPFKDNSFPLIHSVCGIS